MLELYHNDMSTCAQKVRLTLAEKGLAWEGRHLDLREGDQQKPEHDDEGQVFTLARRQCNFDKPPCERLSC